MSKSQQLEKEIALSIEFVKMMTEVPNALEYEENPEAIKPKSHRLSRSEFNAKREAEAAEKWRQATTIEARLGKSEADAWRKIAAAIYNDKVVRRANNAKAERLYTRAARKSIWTRAERRFFSHLQYCQKHGFEAVQTPAEARPAVTVTPRDVAHYPQSAFYLFS
jgi:hypothetical protein